MHAIKTITSEEVARRGYGYVVDPAADFWFRGDLARLADGRVYVIRGVRWAYAFMREEDASDMERPELAGSYLSRVWLRPFTADDVNALARGDCLRGPDEDYIDL